MKMKMMTQDKDDEDKDKDAGRHSWIIDVSVTKQLDVHGTGLVGNGRGRTRDFPTSWT